jgi:hypothetical protein
MIVFSHFGDKSFNGLLLLIELILLVLFLEEQSVKVLFCQFLPEFGDCIVQSLVKRMVEEDIVFELPVRATHLFPRL